MYTDTNHAGCIRTGKSTNGGLILHGGHLIKSWSSTQSVVALSSGESEYHGLVKGVSETLGIRSVLADWRQPRKVTAWTDSSAAKGIANRVGLSKRTWHIAVHQLWIQERVESRDIVIKKVAGEKNPADVGTKYLTQEAMTKHLRRLPVRL